MIGVALNIPDAYRRRAEYMFSVFSQLWGIPVGVVDGTAAGDVAIRYSAGPPGADGDEAGRVGRVVDVRFDERMYDPGRRCRARRHEGLHLWMGEDDDVASADLVAAGFRLLNLLDEQQVDDGARDARGVFRTDALPASRQDVLAVPLVEDIAAWLLRRVEGARPDLLGHALPKWPGGKRYAVAVTHDTDAVAMGAPRELVTNLGKLLTRRERVYADMVRTGVRHFRDPMRDPLFGFPIWQEYEHERSIASSFYLYARVAPLKRDLNNCKSSVVEQRIDWSGLRSMAAEGWEFGLHAPINAKDSIDALAGGKKWIEDQVEAPVYGLRHHYWALDWTAPHKTWRKHVNSGFRYDSSIAWRDVGGLRAASCHPFRPFDPGREKSLDMYELPTCLMDGHVVGQHGDVAADVASGLQTIAEVKARGGVAVLDWHTETACDAFEHRDTMTTLRRILAPLLDDGEAWFATPWEIVRHWHQRQAALEAA